MGETEKLLSCPFCGGKGNYHDYAWAERTGPAFIECNDCSAVKEGDDGSPDAAIAAWNRRAIAQPGTGTREDGLREAAQVANREWDDADALWQAHTAGDAAGDSRVFARVKGRQRAATDIAANILALIATPAPEAGRVERLEAALRPFSAMAGELFARNWNASRVVLALGGDTPRLTAADFFALRAALTEETK